VNEFLDYLKEEVLPGVWSKGVALSRNLKTVEKISPSSETKELKFKIQTTERLLAFQVTLWPVDQDSYCNCGSKLEPCHHIVAVALAYAGGHVEESKRDESDVGTRLSYSWVAEGQKLSLKRELMVNGLPQRLDGSLVGLIGGIQSGRIKMAMPSTTPEDLKLDELFANAHPSWLQVLKVVADFPALPVKGVAGFESLKTNPKPIRETVLIEDADHGGLRLTKIKANSPDQRFAGNLVRHGDTIFTEESAPDFQDRVIPVSGFSTFLTEILPRLRDGYDLDIRASSLPEFADAEPELFFKMEALGEDLYVTPEIIYPAAGPRQVVQKDPDKERELIREIRVDFGLAPKVPTKLGPKEALKLRESLIKKHYPSQAVDAFLGGFLKQADVSLEDALLQKDLLMKLLLMREKRPEIKARFSDFLSTLSSTRRAPHEKTSGYIHEKLLPTLRDYQKQGVKFLAEKRLGFGGAILADDMGLGKTIQTLTLISCRIESPENKRSLVIAPTSLLSNWAAEAKRFRPDLTTCVYHGTTRVLDLKADLVITSYAILRLEPEKFLDTLWDIVILDEAHIIRNPETQAAIATFQLNANFRIALTGTPIQNRKRDLLSLFQFVTPGIFEFEDELDDQLVKTLILRRTKAEVLPELPPKTYLEHSVELTPSERSFYQTIFAAAKTSVVERLDAGENVSPLTLFEILLRSRQALDHPGLVDAAKLAEPSSKLTEILSVVEELMESGHSVLLYSQWTGFLDILERAIKDKLRYLRLDGETKNRGEVVEAFQKDETPTVFLLSLHAGGVGLNLTRASHVMFAEPWWNPYVELQAEDRAYRLGQDKPVTIHRFTTENSIEQALNQLKAEKMKLGEAVFAKQDILNLVSR
jgi:superfamily II DNA or RNA helicase